MAAVMILKILYACLFAPPQIVFDVLKQLITGIHPRGRPSPKWTLRQALMVRLFKALLKTAGFLKLSPPLSMKPGRQGERFIVLQPASSDQYVGPLDDADIRPEPIGATWSPTLPSKNNKCIKVVMFLHGGAYVLGDGRDPSTDLANKSFLEHSGCSHVFWPQYRLATASDNSGRFPAALQDALSAYLHLIRDRNISAGNIVLAGDSAGGNLALALLRYLNEHGHALDIPQPGTALLFSPWTDLLRGDDEPHIRSLPNFHSDYLAPQFGAWGTLAITGHGKVDRKNPYISQTPGHGYKIPIPVWMHTGGSEILLNENARFVEEFRGAGTEIDWVVDEASPHDVLFMGTTLGFGAEARAAGRQAAEFVRRQVTSVEREGSS